MRMIADILGCPFQLSILADSEAAERAANVEDVVPTEKELHKLAKTKARKEKKAREAEQLHAAISMLSDKQAKRIYARYILGMSNVEIAKAEGVSKAAITYSIQRGMRELARRIKKF